jgi:hypothetical protein
MSQKEAAERAREVARGRGVDLKLHSQTLSDYERGVIQKVPNTVLEVLAIVYNVPLVSLVVADRDDLVGHNVSRGTRPNDVGAKSVRRRRRIETFEREMIRLGADDFEADHVRSRARSFLESVLSSGGTEDISEEELDRELELYLQNNLKVWVEEHMAKRGARPIAGLDTPGTGSYRP